MLNIALKEWAVVCDLMLEGGLVILLRKGGIQEGAGPGRFQLEHNRFALYPSWEHQRPELVKDRYRDRMRVLDEPDWITIRGLGEVGPGTIWPVPSREAFDRLDDLHCWSRPQIDMRFNYKPQRPLYLLAVRAYRLSRPGAIAIHSEYAGCRSWVPLRPGDEVDDARVEPVLDETAFDAITARIRAALA